MRSLLIIILTLFAPVQNAAAEKYLVFAAASMKDAMEEIAREFQKDTDDEMVLSLASTARLARQIENRAPADIFISADTEWMDWLKSKGLLIDKSRRIIAGNKLVIVVRREIENWADPLAMLTRGLAAMADPDAVPAGRYAKQALIKLGIWEEVEKNAIRTENVRLALALVARGEVEAAIVYASDSAAEPGVKTAFQFRESIHTKISYPAAVIRGAKMGAGKILEYLTGDKAQKILVKHGFQPAGG